MGWLSRVACRWGDDLWVKQTIWLNPTSRQFDAHVLAWHLQAMVDKITAIYESHFGLKYEDAATFVGLQVDICNRKISTQQLFTKDVPKFQNWLSNKPRSAKVKHVQGQICNCLDRLINGDAVSSLVMLFDAYQLVGYPHSALRQACQAICQKHPYIKDVVHSALDRFGGGIFTR